MIENLTKAENTDTVWCRYEDIKIGVCYNTTANNVEQEEPLLELIKRACESNGETIITGDFNHETIDWDLMEANTEGQRFLDTTEDLFLTQHVKQATREGNILDLVLSTNPDQIRNVAVTEKLGNSDHNIVEFEIVTEERPASWKTKYRDYRKADYEKIREEIQSEEYTQDTEGDTMYLWNKLKDKLNDIVERNIPLKERKNGKQQKPMWWNRKIQRLRKNRLKWWNRYNEANREKFEDKYLYYQRAVNKEIRKAKRKLEKRLAENIKTDRKGFFKYSRSKMKAKQSVGPIEDEQGNLVKDEKQMANIFSKFFTSVFTTEDITNIPEPEQMFNASEEEKLTDIDINVERVRKKLKLMNPTKAPGNDDINPALIAETAEQIAEHVTAIFRKSLDESMVPEDWRTSNITPIHKKDGRSKAENYRGVHLTSQICKSLEGIIKEDIVEHLVKHALIRDSQHGFQAGRSCITNLLEFLEEITKHIDEGSPCDIIYMDFMKAFDKVCHQRLLKKLQKHGIEGKVLRWIEAWLIDRKQRVVLKGECSGWEEVRSGVPQGSVLGPLLFIIFINDIDTGIISILSKFADDCKIAKKVSTDEEADEIQRDLNTLEKWSTTWQMKFHPDKCKVMHIGHNNKKRNYFISGQQIKKVEEEKDLGVLISDDLKSKKHVAKTAKKANQLLGMIKRTMTCKNKDNILNLYTSLVRPILDYGAAVWSPHHQKDIQKIEKVQRRATKMIKEIRNLTYEERLKVCNLTSLENRRKRYDLIETFKIMKNFSKIDAAKLFKMRKSNTRGHNMKIFKEHSRLNIRKYFFSQRVANNWNLLPAETVNSKSLGIFKTKLHKEFLPGGLYMIQ